MISMIFFIRIVRRKYTHAASSTSNSSVVVCTRSQMFLSCAASWFKMCDLSRSPSISSDFLSATLSNVFMLFVRAASSLPLNCFLQSRRSSLTWSARRLFQQSTLYWLIGNIFLKRSLKLKTRITAPAEPPTPAATAPPAKSTPKVPTRAPRKPKRESLNHVWELKTRCFGYKTQIIIKNEIFL